MDHSFVAFVNVRRAIEAVVERLIDLLDLVAGEPDDEASEPLEDSDSDEDAAPCPAIL